MRVELLDLRGDVYRTVSFIMLGTYCGLNSPDSATISSVVEEGTR